MLGESSLKVLWTYPRLLVFAGILFLFRIILMAKFPVVGDEAYYFYWGTHPAGGYYDLPPMVGWWESVVSVFSLQTWWLRMPNLIVQLFITFGIREWTRPFLGQLSSALLAMIYFFLPVPFLAVVMAPDLPLLFFNFYAGVLFFGARRRRDFLLAGALWGGAFLSKYFAIFSLLGWSVWYFTARGPDRRSTAARDISFFALGATPFLFQHLFWNSQNCWSNFVFNLVTRQKVSDGPWWTVVSLFVVYIMILTTPFLWDRVRQQWGRAAGSPSSRSVQEFAFFSWAVPMLCFASLALLGRGQGLHWYVSYLPFFIIWIAVGWDRPRQIRNRLWGLLLLSGGLGLFTVVALFKPEDYVKPILRNQHQFEYQLAFHGDQILEDIHPSLNGMDAVFLDGYSLASVFDLEIKRRYRKKALPVSVMGPGSRFGRVFDFSLPAQKLDGKNILFIARGEWSTTDWARFFETTESRWHEVGGVRFWVSKGIGFRYPLYAQEVLSRVQRDYYPGFLGFSPRCAVIE